MGRQTDHFKCAHCGRLRERRRELSAFSKDVLASKEGQALHKAEQTRLMFCRFCTKDPANLPSAVSRWLQARAEAERKVTPKEAGEDRPPAPVTEKRLLTYREVADEYGLPYGTVTSWAAKGIIQKVSTPSGPRFREEDVVAHLERSTAPPKPEPKAPAAASSPILNPGSYLEALGILAAERRLKKGLSQAEVAKRMKISGSTVSRLEAGTLGSRLQPRIFKAIREWMGADFISSHRWQSEFQAKMAEPEPKKEVVVRHPKGSKAAPETNGHSVQAASLDDLPPWEIEKQKALTERVSELEQKLNDFMEWVRKYEQEAPGWSGWQELHEKVGGGGE